MHVLLAAAVCANVGHCVAASHAALERCDVEGAEKAALAGLRLAECGPEDGPASDGVEVLARVALRRGEPLMARAWLGPHPSNVGLYREVEAAVKQLPPARGPAGRYSQGLRWGLWNEVTITDAATDHVHFELSGQRVAISACARLELLRSGDLSDMVLGLADAAGDATRQGDSFVYESREFALDRDRSCRLVFSFSPDALHLEQGSQGQDCGFGAFADVSGDYLRTK